MKKEYILISTAIVIGTALGFCNKANAEVNSNINVRQNQTILQNQTIQVTVTPTPTTSPTPTTMVTIKPLKRVEIKVALKKTNAIKEIDRRLESLNKLTAKIIGIKGISEIQKGALIDQIKGEISNLEVLKIEIENETVATALQEEKKSITQSYRIYALFIPKIEILAHADKIIEIANSMAEKTNDQALRDKIEISITKAKSAMDIVMTLLPEEYPFKTKLQAARDMLKDARTNLNTVYSSLKAE